MRGSILCILPALASAWDNRFRSDCAADNGGNPGRRLQAEPVAKANATFLELDGVGAQPPPMDPHHIYTGTTCLPDTFVSGGLFGKNKGTCKWFACNADRFAYCDDQFHCKCPDGSCAVAQDPKQADVLTCQIQRVKVECPPASGIFWMMEHIEVEYDQDDNSCTFQKTTGIDNLWDAVAWSDNDNIRNITWHTIGKDADRDFGYSNDPIADSTEEPITNGVACSMDIKGEVSPPTGLVVMHGGHTTTVTMDITSKTNTHFRFEGKEWGNNLGNKNVAQNMHAHMWIKQRCGKLKVTDIHLDVPCILSDWSGWGKCHPDHTKPNAKTCGPGVQDRERKIVQQGTYGKECKDPLVQHQDCNQGCCPVDCVVSQWSPWGDCTEECGGGEQTRTRKVTTDMECRGTPCPPLEEKQNCNFWVECNETDCEWSDWGKYGDCSAQCNGGTHSRFRQIVKESKEGGKQCVQEDSVQVETCNTQACDPIDCEWTAWGDWGACNADCNGGVRSKSRQVKVEAQYGGAVCDAASEEAEECQVQPCSEHWTAGEGAEIAPDGVTFIGDAANAVVYSQIGVESISVRNRAVSGSVQIGLAQDGNADFNTGKSIVLPYKGAKSDDIITIGSQSGHARVYLNHNPKPVEDLGAVADNLLGKVILDQATQVRIDGLVLVAPAESAMLEAVNMPKQATAPSQAVLAALAAASVSMVAAIAYHRRKPVAGAQQPLLQ